MSVYTPSHSSFSTGCEEVSARDRAGVLGETSGTAGTYSINPPASADGIVVHASVLPIRPPGLSAAPSSGPAQPQNMAPPGGMIQQGDDDDDGEPDGINYTCVRAASPSSHDGSHITSYVGPVEQYPYFPSPFKPLRPLTSDLGSSGREGSTIIRAESITHGMLRLPSGSWFRAPRKVTDSALGSHHPQLADHPPVVASSTPSKAPPGSIDIHDAGAANLPRSASRSPPLQETPSPFMNSPHPSVRSAADREPGSSVEQSRALHAWPVPHPRPNSTSARRLALRRLRISSQPLRIRGRRVPPSTLTASRLTGLLDDVAVARSRRLDEFGEDVVSMAEQEDVFSRPDWQVLQYPREVREYDVSKSIDGCTRAFSPVPPKLEEPDLRGPGQTARDQSLTSSESSVCFTEFSDCVPSRQCGVDDRPVPSGSVPGRSGNFNSSGRQVRSGGFHNAGFDHDNDPHDRAGNDGNGGPEPSEKSSPDQGEPEGGYSCVLYKRGLCGRVFDDCKKNFKHVSGLRQHHKKHGFHYCLDCMAAFLTENQIHVHECAYICLMNCHNYGKNSGAWDFNCGHSQNKNVSPAKYHALMFLAEKRFRRDPTNRSLETHFSDIDASVPPSAPMPWPSDHANIDQSGIPDATHAADGVDIARANFEGFLGPWQQISQNPEYRGIWTNDKIGVVNATMEMLRVMMNQIPSPHRQQRSQRQSQTQEDQPAEQRNGQAGPDSRSGTIRIEQNADRAINTQVQGMDPLNPNQGDDDLFKNWIHPDWMPELLETPLPRPSENVSLYPSTQDQNASLGQPPPQGRSLYRELVEFEQDRPGPSDPNASQQQVRLPLVEDPDLDNDLPPNSPTEDRHTHRRPREPEDFGGNPRDKRPKR